MNKKVIRILQNIIDLNPRKPVYVVCNEYVREEGGVCPECKGKKTFKHGNYEYSCKKCDGIGLKTVPMLPKFLMKNQTVDSMVEFSRFKSSLIDMDAEGKVYRVLDEGGFVVDSFKVINPDFLIKNGD